jgi:hypothetical protein
MCFSRSILQEIAAKSSCLVIRHYCSSILSPWTSYRPIPCWAFFRRKSVNLRKEAARAPRHQESCTATNSVWVRSGNRTTILGSELEKASDIRYLLDSVRALLNCADAVLAQMFHSAGLRVELAGCCSAKFSSYRSAAAQQPAENIKLAFSVLDIGALESNYLRNRGRAAQNLP